MSPQFSPKRADGRSAGQVVRDYLVQRMEDGTLATGDIISHSELAAGAEIRAQGSAYYQAVGQGTRLLERDCNRSLRAVRGAGYQLIEGTAMLDKGREYGSKAHRAEKRGLAVVTSIDSSGLPATERELVREVRRGMANVVAILSMQAERLANHDEQLNLLKTARMDDRARVHATEQEIADLKARMLKMEEERDR